MTAPLLHAILGALLLISGAGEASAHSMPENHDSVPVSRSTPQSPAQIPSPPPSDAEQRAAAAESATGAGRAESPREGGSAEHEDQRPGHRSARNRHVPHHGDRGGATVRADAVTPAAAPVTPALRGFTAPPRRLTGSGVSRSLLFQVFRH
ncbi:hypothetical protein [Streptomyces tsukubensis]|nr:hypothetical protein [Streptomyces tsukubensis]QFR96727.1 hypothetical protein GBW32_31435 [Streptomyces tsukubensis]